MLEKYLIEGYKSLSSKRCKEIYEAISEIRQKMDLSQKESPYHQNPRLLLATKTRTPDEINFAKEIGIDLIGENRVQELLDKYDKLQRDGLEIHFIGALQTNKVKYIIDKVDVIHSLDRLSLAKEIDRQAKKINKIMKVLVEVNIGDEESKSGLSVQDVIPFLNDVKEFKNIQVCGLMSIPPILTTKLQQKQYFQKIMGLYIDISTKKIDNISMDVLSFGMSSDYDVAIECGSNLVRIGTAAFGSRNYN